MNIIFVPKKGSCSNTFRLNSWSIFFSLTFLSLLVGSIAWGGFYLGKLTGEANVGTDAMLANWKNEITKQRTVVNETRRSSKENIDALAVRLGRLQSHVIRLDALGERLTKMAELDKGEFDFSTQPAQGGPESTESSNSIKVADFAAALESLSHQIDNRGQQLALLEAMLMNQSLQEQVSPAGRPIRSGWLSSYFGMRTDPFTGRQERHKGVDFAGKAGSDVISVASGVVTWAGKRYGYGNLVEVNHGNGYATRYGHNSDVLVKVGDAVKKGHKLALMGSTGRSTGPHVHFEVLHNGKAVDPMKYIKSVQ
ncbi:MAG: M23 family metallopeptidase [Gammaproteobacteria bacterium]|nr:M23 family metallopeptidase [Gammaproteobacteria bacterium]MDH5800080.1 M23 family metallopeptidase [Gammaproteobacteria bacterium]